MNTIDKILEIRRTTFDSIAQQIEYVEMLFDNLNERIHGLVVDLEGNYYVLSPIMGRKIGGL